MPCWSSYRTINDDETDASVFVSVHQKKKTKWSFFFSFWTYTWWTPWHTRERGYQHNYSYYTHRHLAVPFSIVYNDRMFVQHTMCSELRHTIPSNQSIIFFVRQIFQSLQSIRYYSEVVFQQHQSKWLFNNFIKFLHFFSRIRYLKSADRNSYTVHIRSLKWVDLFWSVKWISNNRLQMSILLCTDKVCYEFMIFYKEGISISNYWDKDI
jgi:hypothetical protein